jgi:NAD(P)-dependent dehydrogenase (short-subunit alcohol dehydrogenase family)
MSSESATGPLQGIDDAVIARYALDQLPFSQAPASPAALMDIKGSRVLVTGGGGGDLGQACVHRLAALGARVAVLDIDVESAAGVAKAASERWGADAFPVRGDVTDWDDIHGAVASAADRMGGLDVIVNNAGGALRLHGPFAGQEREAIERTIALNFTGVIFATRAALGPMLSSGRGRIINIASEGGKMSLEGIAVYNACKSAVIGLTRNLARDLAGSGISPVAVCPGVMVGPHALERLRGGSTEASRAALEYSFERLTLGRFSLPEEVANVVAFLASPAGAYIHATAISVGGGLSD